MREETSWAFLEYNTFSFCEPVAWQQFRDEHTIAQLNHMRAIELYTMAATVEFEDGYGEGNGDPYARMPGDDWWRFDGVSILKNVTNIVLGFRDPPQRYNGRFNQNIDLIGRALDSAFGDLSGLKRLKDVNVFIIMDPHYYVYRQGNTMETNEQIEILLSLFGSKLEMKLLASNPHNIVQSTNHWENLDSMAISRLRGEQVEV
ncbi:MAG: hypothetical protein OHK93_003053 [Ramalina farinacea]|uniref:Uncharacterized protein n=1 Tax=Ramalina farinacea TaxID=258253 RepID=A0AA43QTC7_9LECA|nr:hypothetical protein [Ramalina farinacea]